MKKITFVQRDGSTSYDPVSTFFSKTNNKQQQSVSKPSSSSYKSSSIKPPVSSSFTTNNNNINTQKILNRKQAVPVFNNNKTNNTTVINKQQYERLKQQTIYDLQVKQKQLSKRVSQKKQLRRNQHPIIMTKQNVPNKNSNNNNNKKLYNKPQMVFDIVVDTNKDEDISVSENLYQHDHNDNKRDDNKMDDKLYAQGDITSSNRLPQITKTPVIQTRAKKPQTLSSQSKAINNTHTNNNVNKQKPTTTATNKQSITSTTKNNTKATTTDKLPIPQKQTHQTITKPIQNNQNQYDKVIVDQYERKIDQLQAKIQSLVKIQQKYTKLLKQQKQCKQRNNNYNKLQTQLKQTKLMMNKLLQPNLNTMQRYNNYQTKRQILLTNQINKLKRTNKQLVLRIKSYKGSDLVSMAMVNNKEQICRQIEVENEYQEECHSVRCREMSVEMESGLKRIIALVRGYLEMKATSGINGITDSNKRTKKQQPKSTNLQQQSFSLQQQHKFLQQLISLSQHLSLTYLFQYNICPLPECNQSAMNLYAEIQQQKQNILKRHHQLIKKQHYQKVIPLEEINFAISQMNLGRINDLNENMIQTKQLQKRIKQIVGGNNNNKINRDSNINNNKETNSSMNSTMMNFNKNNNRPTTSYNNNNTNNKKSNTKISKQQLTNTITQLLIMHNQRSRLSTLFYIQSITQFVYLKQLLQTKMQQLSKQLNTLSYRLHQLKQIYDLGDTIGNSRQALWLYLQTNINNLTQLTVPNLTIDIKQIHSLYKQINSKLCRKQANILMY